MLLTTTVPARADSLQAQNAKTHSSAPTKPRFVKFRGRAPVLLSLLVYMAALLPLRHMVTRPIVSLHLTPVNNFPGGLRGPGWGWGAGWRRRCTRRSPDYLSGTT